MKTSPSNGRVKPLASELNLLLVMPDTSPRVEAVADDEAYNLGQGAGFYLNATIPPWASHYRMFDYFNDEPPKFISISSVLAIGSSLMGHSTGGHGALLMALRHPGYYLLGVGLCADVNPQRGTMGRKALGEYLGQDEAQWQQWDICRPLSGDDEQPMPIMIN